MGKYKEIREIVFDVLSDREWHTVDEIQKKCEEGGDIFKWRKKCYL